MRTGSSVTESFIKLRADVDIDLRVAYMHACFSFMANINAKHVMPNRMVPSYNCPADRNRLCI